MSELHIMLDTETLAKPSLTGFPLLFSIGAVKFDRENLCPFPNEFPRQLDGHCFYRIINVQSALDAGFQIDASTLQWWLEQSAEARVELNRALAGGDPVLDVLNAFQEWVEGASHIWSHGLDFDVAILRAAFTRFRKSFVFPHRGMRDTRTLFALTPEFTKAEFFPDAPVEHHALWDAWRQAVAVQRCYARLSQSRQLYQPGV